MQLIGIDTGGTFTDSIAVLEDGSAGTGKALSTPGRLHEGVLNSLEETARSLEIPLEDLLTATDVLSHGTTVGLNALLTGTGANVALLVTEGFEGTLPIARSNKVHGLPDNEFVDALRWRKPPLLVPRERIRGIRERIDSTGAVVTALDENRARAIIRELAAEGVNAIGVSLLWSPVNDTHERRLAQLIAEEAAPGTHVTLSCDLAPRIGEYERTSTVAINAYIAPLVSDYLTSLEQALRQRGFTGLFLVTTMGGGVRQVASLIAAPVHTLQSGPVGGLSAARQLGASLEQPNVIATDVGGTSFDVGLVIEGALPRASRPRIERHGLAVPIVDLASIGTGGGSIAWVDPRLNVLRVGPASAGSSPGPACYARGGTAPTVTDAAVVLGYLDRLGGSLRLDVAAAARAVETVARPLELDVRSAADGILRIANAQMADLVRRMTVQRGQDPRDFVLYAYGGAAPQYVGRYAADIGAKAIVIPRLAPEFSAWGAICSDLRMLVEHEFAPRPLQDAIADLNRRLERISREASEELSGAGAELQRRGGGALTLRRSLGLRFSRQTHRLEIPVNVLPLDARAVQALEADFRGRYERIVGPGSAYEKSVVEVVTALVEARMEVRIPPAERRSDDPAAAPAPTRRRTAWFEAGAVETPVYDWNTRLRGARLAGPCFIESPQTTAIVYPGQHAACDALGNLHLEIA